MTLFVLVAFATPTRAAPQPDYRYGGAELTRWWNDQHPHPSTERIDLLTGRRLARWFNAITEAKLRAWLEAVASRDLVWRWQLVANCESGDNIYAVSASGTYKGWLQFDQRSWSANGGSGSPYGQPRHVAARIAENYRLRSGTSPWPHCGRYYR